MEGKDFGHCFSKQYSTKSVRNPRFAYRMRAGEQGILTRVISTVFDGKQGLSFWRFTAGIAVGRRNLKPAQSSPLACSLKVLVEKMFSLFWITCLLDCLVRLACIAMGQKTSRHTWALAPACGATFPIVSVVQQGFSTLGRVPDGTRGGPSEVRLPRFACRIADNRLVSSFSPILAQACAVRHSLVVLTRSNAPCAARN